MSRRGGWNYSSDDASPELIGVKHRRRQATSINDALWTAAERSGATWKHLKTDLAMLGGSEEHRDILEAFAKALKMLGNKLVPRLGLEPVDNVIRARPEAQEVIFLLATLAGDRSSPHQGQRVAVDPSVGSLADGMCKGKGKDPGVEVIAGSVQGKGIFVPPP